LRAWRRSARTARRTSFPIVFALDGDRAYHALDHKPKRTTALRRLENIAANPRVSLLADEYDGDWRRLWWVRADGAGRVLANGCDEARASIVLLCEGYAQYRERPPSGPLVAIAVERWTGWSASEPRV